MSSLVFAFRISRHYTKTSIFLLNDVRLPEKVVGLRKLFNSYSPESQSVLHLLNTYYSPHLNRTHHEPYTDLNYWWWPKNLPWENPIHGYMPYNIQDMIVLELYGSDNVDEANDEYTADGDNYNPQNIVNTSLWPLFDDAASYMTLLRERHLCSFIGQLSVRRMALFLVDNKYSWTSEVLLLEDNKMLHPLALKAFNYLWNNPTIRHRSRAFLQVSYFASNVNFKDPLEKFRREMFRSKLHWQLPPNLRPKHLSAHHLRGVEKILHVFWR